MLLQTGYACAAVFALAVSASATEVSIAADGMLVAEGRRLFVIGLYEYPADDAALDEVARAGFNLVRGSEETAALDRLRARDLYAWLNTGGRIELPENASESGQALRDMVANWASHPALLVWEVPDEALWSCWLAAYRQPGMLLERWAHFKRESAKLAVRMQNGYQMLRQWDPAHPVWINHAAGNSLEELACFGRAADIVGCDIYPVMPYVTRPVDVSRRLLGSIGQCTIRMQASAPRKPVWMVLQGFSWGEVDDLFERRPGQGQAPTFEESRFMAYEAIVRGARGVLYWGTHLHPKDSGLWKDLLRLVRELADIQHVLAAPDAPGPVAVETRAFGFYPLRGGNANLAVRALGKEVEGATWWIIVNELPFPCTYVLRNTGAPEGQVHEELTLGGSQTLQEAAITGSLPAYGVHVLKPGPHP